MNDATRPGGSGTAAAAGEDAVARARWALLYGNFAIGCGVMVVPGSLNDIVRSLGVSVALGGQLVAIAAAVMCFGAPLAAALIGGFDRRRLLVLSLAGYGAGHALCALAPHYAALVPLRAVSVLGAAIFTPQAAAAIGTMASADQRGSAITFIFLGWSLASVLGMPVHSYIGESFGWRYAFVLVALLSAIGAAWVWRAMPDGVRPPSMDRSAWREVVTHPALMAIVLVTALSGAGQFTLFSYFAPYMRQTLAASPGEVSFLFFWFGAFGLLGNVLLARHIDRVGASRAVSVLLGSIALSMLVWPLGHATWSLSLAIAPWAFGCFASNSAQQARLGLVAPALTPALMALNTSAIYLGQAAGAAGGGALIAASGFGVLHWVGLAWVLLALALSRWASRRLSTVAAHA